MSDSYRHVDIGWNPQHPNWPVQLGDLTPKAQAKDRPSKNKHDRFVKGQKNSRYNLLKKIDQLKKEESNE